MPLTVFLIPLGPTEIIIILVIILLLFGGRKIPELMRGLGRGMKEFKDASKGENVPEKKVVSFSTVIGTSCDTSSTLACTWQGRGVEEIHVL